MNTVTRQRRTNELYEMETTTVAVAVAVADKKDMSAAHRGAALKREKKIAAGLARAAGQAAAARRRAEDQTVRQRAIAEETAAIDRKIAAARHMLGVRENEPNPTAICLMVETLTAQMRVRLSEKGFW